MNEGGGIHVNGAGTVMVTETVQMDAGRNPGWSRNQVEEELKHALGAERIIWMPRGLTRDYGEFGTRGHIDIVACFANENTVLFHDQRNPEHPDFWISAETRRVLKAVGKTPPGMPAAEVTGSTGKLKVMAVPAPEVLQDDEGWVDFSYINHYACNGAVILCAFDDAGDERAQDSEEGLPRPQDCAGGCASTVRPRWRHPLHYAAAAAAAEGLGEKSRRCPCPAHCPSPRNLSKPLARADQG